VLMRQRLDVALLGQASRAGVREVVDAEDLNALAEACRRSRELSERLGAGGTERAEGRVVTVFSAKGGCGKTTLSTNIAAHLAGAGTRTLLVDLDLAFGDVAIALGLDPQCTMADVVPMAGHVDGPGLASVVTHHECGLDVLCAPPHPGDADRVQAALVGELLRAARREYAVVVVDTPPYFNEHVIAAFDTTDVSLVMATLDIPSVKNLRLALDTLDLLGHPRELRRVVINRADAKTGLSISDVVGAIHHPVDAQVPDSTDVTQATNRGVPLVRHLGVHRVMDRADHVGDG
jgi:pilus assembly protein CpaE